MKNRLRVLRAEAGLTQAQLAERLAVSRQAVNALEVEKHDPSLDLAYRISVCSVSRWKTSSRTRTLSEKSHARRIEMR